jgi:hypothetical protein
MPKGKPKYAKTHPLKVLAFCQFSKLFSSRKEFKKMNRVFLCIIVLLFFASGNGLPKGRPAPVCLESEEFFALP